MRQVEPWTWRNCGHLLLFCAFFYVVAVLSFWGPLAEEAWFAAGPVLRSLQQDRNIKGPVVGSLSTSSPSRVSLEEKSPSTTARVSDKTPSTSPALEATPTPSSSPAAKPQRVSKIYINSVWGWPDAGLVDCPVPCEVVRNDEGFRSADAVVWNYRWLTGLPKLQQKASWHSKPPGQRWVANYDFESPPTSLPRGADMAQIAAGVDWVASFQSHSDFWKPIMFMNPRRGPPEERNFAEGKDKLLLWYVSNCGASTRMSIFKSLASHLPEDKVVMMGGCGVRDACKKRQNVECTEKTMRRFKFYAAFENGRCDNYITEKFRRGFKHGMVPIAWGGVSRADYERLVPKDSFIHVDDFKDTKALAEHLMKLDGDDASYNRYFEWRRHFELVLRPQIETNVTCQLCLEVQKPLHEQKPHRSDWQKHFWGCRG